MKKQILALMLCVCIACTGFVYAAADSEHSGDANGDGTITAADAAFVLRYTAGYESARSTTRTRMLSDVNHDGVMNEQDAAMILRNVVRLSPLTAFQTDAALLNDLNKQSLLYDDDLTEWVAQFIQSLTNENVKNVLYAGAQYLGTPYGTGSGQMDCSRFVTTAYEKAGVKKTVYPGKSSDSTLRWFQTNHPEQLHETDMWSWKDWKPGSVLIYINTSTGKGSHLALYVGEIDGEPIVMESRRSGCDGVRLGYLMGSSDAWDLAYYVDPLG